MNCPFCNLSYIDYKPSWIEKHEQYYCKMNPHKDEQKLQAFKQQEKERAKLYRQENLEKERERKKIYYQEHKEQIKENKKQYYEENKEKILTDKKQYREENKEKLKEKKMEYYETHKDEIREKRNIKVTCECGRVVSNSGLSRHKQSPIHKKLMLNTSC